MELTVFSVRSFGEQLKASRFSIKNVTLQLSTPPEDGCVATDGITMTADATHVEDRTVDTEWLLAKKRFCTVVRTSPLILINPFEGRSVPKDSALFAAVETAVLEQNKTNAKEDVNPQRPDKTKVLAFLSKRCHRHRRPQAYDHHHPYRRTPQHRLPPPPTSYYRSSERRSLQQQSPPTSYYRPRSPDVPPPPLPPSTEVTYYRPRSPEGPPPPLQALPPSTEVMYYPPRSPEGSPPPMPPPPPMLHIPTAAVEYDPEKATCEMQQRNDASQLLQMLTPPPQPPPQQPQQTLADLQKILDMVK